ncbi:MAG: hypothetical protein DRG30_08000 [Epsilonproteobacteria bacterium]|nr:MAG: hypothetical protein DRG30_08000 [Campylobacterota bacterium]
MTLNKSLYRHIGSFIFSTFLITSLYAENISSKIIFGVDKNKTVVADNLSFVKNLFVKEIKAQELQSRCDLNFTLISYGDYRAIELSPITTLKNRQSIILLLKPHFLDLFVINNNADYKDRQIHKVYQPITIDSYPEQTTVAIELIKKLEDESIVDHILGMQSWLDKWHALIVILLLGGFFYYRRFSQFTKMKEQQKILSKEQDKMETKLKE